MSYRIFIGYLIVLLIALILGFHSPLTIINVSKDKIPSREASLQQRFEKAKSIFERNDLDSAYHEFLQLKAEFENAQEWGSTLRCMLFLADIHKAKSSYDSVFYYIGLTKAIASKHFDENTLIFAEINHKYGVALIDKGSFDEARPYIEKAIQLRTRPGLAADSSLSLSYNSLGNIFFYTGRYHEARDFYAKALNNALLTKKNKDLDVSFFYQNMGIIHASMGYYDSANFYMNSSLALSRQLLSADDSRLGRLYMNIGRLFYLSGSNDSAMHYYDLAQNVIINNLGPDHFSVANLLLNKGTIFGNKSDYEAALNYYNRALAIFLNNYSDTHPNVLATFMNIGYIYEKKENYPKAIEYYLKSINEEKPLPSNIKTYRNLANIYSLLKNYPEAELYFKKALDLSRRLLGSNHPETILSNIAYARYLFQTRKYTESLRLLKGAEDFYHIRLSDDSRQLSNIYTLTGNNYLGLQKTDLAVHYADKAIKSIVESSGTVFDATKISENQLAPERYLFNALHLKAIALHRKYLEVSTDSLLIQALATYDLSTKLISKIRAGYQSQESRLMITENVNDIYPEALNCALDLYHRTFDTKYLEMAFRFSEQGKAAVLLTSLQEIEAKQIGQLPAELLHKEEKLKQAIHSYNQLLYDEKLTQQPNLEKIRIWERKVFEFNVKYDSLLQAMDRQYPDYYQQRFGFEMAPLSDIQKKMKHDQALVSFTMSEQSLYTFAITPDTALSKIQTLPVDFQERLSQFRTYLIQSDFSSFMAEDFNNFKALGFDLYQLLIKPIEEVLGDKRLIIVPDHQLGYLPFEVLITEQYNASKLDFGSLSYLMKDHPISYTYSATLLFGQLNKQNKKYCRLLAFAPDYEKQTSRSLNDNQIEELLPIPWAKKEVENISRTYQAKSFVGSRATESAFKSKASGYKILHLAMHTLIDNDSPTFSKLVFAPQADSLEDGFLNTYELFNLELNADLAVLSACKTGDGRLSRGEGIMSLARGFFFAGVPSIVMTLWSVEDQASSELVIKFYNFLSKGYEKDQALQMAKLAFLSSTDKIKSHPHFWAGFVNIGNSEPVSIQKAQPWLILILTGVILAMAGIFWIVRKHRQKR